MKIKNRISIQSQCSAKETKIIKRLSNALLDELPNVIGVSIELIYVDNRKGQ